ncbi:MAG: hypothetical protein IT363_08970 [Methanoregulaceae archaeon]|nr:hypothetical protein [Methanoregulaceae archaeon]
MTLAILALAVNTFVTFESDRYSFEVPKGWNVGKETPWGARDVVPGNGSGKLGAMTAGPTRASWEELYRTSLYFIKREGEGKETPFRVGKTKQGYESMSFEMINKDGWADRRYTLLKNDAGSALALSVKIPTRKDEKQYAQWFQHMVDTAKLR